VVRPRGRPPSSNLPTRGDDLYRVVNATVPKNFVLCPSREQTYKPLSSRSDLASVTRFQTSTFYLPVPLLLKLLVWAERVALGSGVGNPQSIQHPGQAGGGFGSLLPEVLPQVLPQQLEPTFRTPAGGLA
jgi:hypothetical protein